MQDPNGCVIGSKVVSVKAMEDKEQHDKKRLKTMTYYYVKLDGVITPTWTRSRRKNIAHDASQKAAACIDDEEVAKQSGRNKSPTGVRDRPSSVENPAFYER